MAIQFTCPQCRSSTLIDDKYAGQSGPCRHCGANVTVPMPGGSPVTKRSNAALVLLLVIVLAILGVIGLVGLGVSFAVPAMQQAKVAARRQTCSNNLKQIGLALHNYHDVYKSFPPAYTVDADGNLLHSWRTLLLPFLEAQHIYNEIDLQEPWDGPNNRVFNHLRIPAFECPVVPPSPNAPGCSYLAIVGPNCVFQGSNAINLSQIVDGTSNTVMVVETRGNTRSWMEPYDLDATQMRFAFHRGPTEPGSFHPGGLHVCFCDGAVRFVATTFGKRTFQAMTTINGRETVQLP